MSRADKPFRCDPALRARLATQCWENARRANVFAKIAVRGTNQAYQVKLAALVRCISICPEAVDLSKESNIRGFASAIFHSPSGTGETGLHFPEEYFAKAVEARQVGLRRYSDRSRHGGYDRRGQDGWSASARSA